MPVYSETLLPSVWKWLLAPAGGAAAGIITVVLGVPVAVVVGVVVTIALVAVLVRTAPVTVVTDDELRAGRAHLPREFVGSVEILEGSALEQAMGPGLDARAHLQFSSSAPAAVRVDLRDPQDPTPYWLLSTRHAHELARALVADADQAAHSEQTG
ncbi:DUF3093 domain-containing protein [Occultella glacieicola]|uniref:DUF3093 domain-containing protein n=1 Tax=Occultella glacieicola TaxID=2518684 RepID=UPI001404F78C|nr:DUF3093 domain-containing protein [Occultella glacieicola]